MRRFLLEGLVDTKILLGELNFFVYVSVKTLFSWISSETVIECKKGGGGILYRVLVCVCVWACIYVTLRTVIYLKHFVIWCTINEIKRKCNVCFYQVHSIFTVNYFCLQQNYECWEWHPCFWNNAEIIEGYKAISNIGEKKSVGHFGVHLSILWDFWPIEQLLWQNACGYNQEEWCCSDALDLYLGGAQFESWPGHWLSCVMWCFSGKILG